MADWASDMSIWLGSVGAYLFGSIPFGFLLGRLMAGEDIRKQGSGNIGATNVSRVLGKKLGVLTLLLDVSKGALPVLIAQSLGLALSIQAFWGLAAFTGHCFPIWLKFKGGKGVATGLGAIGVVAPQSAAIGMVAFGCTYALFRRVSIGSLVGALTAFLAISLNLKDEKAVIFLGLLVGILILRHKENIIRLWQKKELRL